MLNEATDFNLVNHDNVLKKQMSMLTYATFSPNKKQSKQALFLVAYLHYACKLLTLCQSTTNTWVFKSRVLPETLPAQETKA